MTSLSLLLWILFGIALQLGVFLGISFWRLWRAYLRLKQGLPEEREAAGSTHPQAGHGAGWAGFRTFRVASRVTEDASGQICSFHLEPEDGQPLPAYRPGQFLTFNLDISASDGRDASRVVRCYSLSEAPRPDRYRVSIKRVPAAPGTGHPPGRSSNFFHDRVQVGATIGVRAPSGHFFLEPGDAPIVLIAGGIGITPLFSMIEWCHLNQPAREVWLFYGVRNGKELAFAQRLREMASENPQLHLRVCFSAPRPEDVAGRDFNHRGRVDMDLLRLSLPLKAYHYYICGPTSMLETLVPALGHWGVPDARIHFEAFGPASVKRQAGAENPATEGESEKAAVDCTVTFAVSGKQVAWSPGSGTLLELAEAHGVAVDSGCRAGGCGTCQTTIRSGEVAYQQPPDFDPEPGRCLLCVCTPRTDVTLEA